MSDSDNWKSYGKPCEEWADAIVAHAMRPGEPRPDSELGGHLADCRECAAYLEWLAPATGVLAEAVTSVSPPSGMKARVMAEVRSDAARPAPRAGIGVRFAWPRWALPALAAAAAVIAVVAIAGSGSGGDELAPTDTYRLSMSSGGAVGELVTSGDEAVLHLDGMKPSPPGHVYQAWIRDGQELRASTVFVVSRAGAAEAAIPEGMDGADELLVTVEPKGGSAEPTTRPRMAVNLN